MIEENEKSGMKFIMEHIDELVDQWDQENIIYEDFHNIGSVILEHSKRLLYDKIVENGGHESSLPYCEGIEIENEGWMYGFYDMEKIEPHEARKLIVKHFK